MNRAGYVLKNREDIPDEQREALRSAVRWQIFTIGYTICTIAIVAFILGNSQSMKTAWIEDMLSLIPQIVFLIALRFIKLVPSRKHPYGYHRIMETGHLVAGVTLLAVGTHLLYDAVTGLLAAEHPTIGTISLFGEAVWLGWIMMVVMAVIIIGPVFLYGPAKKRLAPKLHNKILYADADMARADWHTNVSTIVGVFGIGLGLWWLDGAAAAFISIGIISDGFKNTRSALFDLMDQRARTTDDSDPHPLGEQIVSCARAKPWVADAAIRLRDQGQVFHVEVFVTPTERSVDLEKIADLAAEIADLDWKVQDVVIVPTDPLPEAADPCDTKE